MGNCFSSGNAFYRPRNFRETRIYSSVMSSARHAKPRKARFPGSAPPVPPVEAAAPPSPERPGGGGRHRAPAARRGLPAPAVAGAAAVAVAAGGMVVVPGLGSPDGTAISASEAALLVATDLVGADAVATSDATSTDLARPARPLGRTAAQREGAATQQREGAAERATRTTERAPLAQVAEPTGATEVAEARKRARSLLEAKTTEIAASAQRAAAAAVPDALDRRGCGYNPGTQRRPDLSSEQRRNVRAIVDVAKEMGLPPRAAVIALATAQQESWLRNLGWGDRDSLGLFQQRPSMGWGSPSQVRNPEYAARAFYNVLKDVDGWERLPLTVAAQRVQRSAFGWAYARWELMAARLVQGELDVPAAALACAKN